ncbi:MAG: MFS transporter, partial [Chloroflexi bacterium]|nr:MFS transporter [Chloroflexota bacterium]
LAIPGLVGIVIAPLAGYLGDRWGVGRTLLAGMVVTLTGLVGIFLFPGALPAFPLFLLFMGIGNTATTTNLGAMSLMQWPHLRQAVSGVFNGSRFLGLAVAPLVMAPVYEAYSLRGVLVVSAAVLVGTAALVGRVAAPRRSVP